MLNTSWKVSTFPAKIYSCQFDILFIIGKLLLSDMGYVIILSLCHLNELNFLRSRMMVEYFLHVNMFTGLRTSFCESLGHISKKAKKLRMRI